MATTTKGFPYPVAGDGRPHIDQDIAALASTIDEFLMGLTDAEIALLAGAGLFAGRNVLQTSTGTTRKQRGLYAYDGAAYQPAAPFGSPIGYTPTLTVISGTDPVLGSTGTVLGEYLRWGRLVIGRAEIVQNGTGVTNGSGTFQILLPLAAATQPNRIIGRWVFSRGGSPPKTWGGALRLVDATHAELSLTGSGGGAAINLGSATSGMGTITPVNTLCHFEYIT
jgi:hypothetical protein